MLTNLEIRNEPRPDRPKKLTDGQGLYLLLTPAGGRWWRFAYRYGGRQKTLALGTYPTVSLVAARRKLEEAREALRQGQDPAVLKRLARQAQHHTERLRDVGAEWIQRQTHVSRKSRARYVWALGLVDATLGGVPIRQLTAQLLASAFLDVQDRVSTQAAARARETVSAILRAAVAAGRVDRDVTRDLRGVLRPVVVTHFAALLEPARVGACLRAIDDIEGAVIVRAAMRLAPLVFVRPGELRTAQWGDIDLEAAVWRIPAIRMKQREPHVVPLARQAVEILTALKPLTGPRATAWVFPAVRTPRRPMSDGTMNAAFRRLGYGRDEITPHGWRATARTLLAEVLHIDPYIIEAQLAHAIPGPLGATYARTQYLAQRATMMQQWADYLDTLKAAATRR